MEPESSYWNYRVLHRTGNGGDDYFSIIEVYYRQDGSIWAWSETSLAGDDLTDLEGALHRMMLVAGLANLKNPKHRALTLDDLPPTQKSEIL